ncbi:MAG TPA: VOC family protein [Candidatus Eisenbacteria bacterium]|nr:VOC family protein [Candidatus Eisenbacteria bacterium]
MVANPPPDTPRITPYLLYHDVGAALDYLSRVFGFHEKFRMAGPDGKVNHAEVTLKDGLVMMGSPGGAYRSPKELGGTTQFLYIYVDDVDAHHRTSVQAGAKILSPPEDQFYGDRRYSAEDPEGFQWFFAQHVREVSEEEIKQHA